MKDILKAVAILLTGGALLLGFIWAAAKYVDSLPGQNIEFSVLDHGVELRYSKDYEKQ